MFYLSGVLMPFAFRSKFQISLWLVFFAVVFFIGPAPIWAADEKSLQPENDLQRTIDILEDDQKRADVLKLLKIMAAAGEKAGEGSGAPAEGQPAVESVDDTEFELERGIKTYLSGQLGDSWRNLKVLPTAFSQAVKSGRKAFDSLGQQKNIDIWRPYFMKMMAWGLICLMVVWLILKKYGHMPRIDYSWGARERARALMKYLFIVSLPNLLLILSILAIPPLSPTLPGITADMATGFDFIYSCIQHFFVNLSILSIILRLASAMLSPGGDGRPLVDVHPMVGRHFLRTWSVFFIYVAIYIFIDATFLDSFAGGLLYSICLILMAVPIPLYLTARLLKLKRLVHAVGEAEASAGPEPKNQPETDYADNPPPLIKIDYQASLLIHKYWAPLLISWIWLITFIALVNPLGLAGSFGCRILATQLIPLAGLIIVKLSRRLVLHLVNPESEEGRRVLLNADNLTNFLVWIVVALLVVMAWGLPLERLIENLLLRDILARAVAILVVLTVLVVFIRFSHLTTDWLLAVPSMETNRNWRTITPLVLASIRALAVFVAVVVILERLGVNIGPILAGAGILGLGVGMGAQSLVKDVINGISILLMDTLAVGDWIKVGGHSGTVTSVGIRSLRLRDASGNLIVVPNSSVDTIINMTKDYSQDLVEFIIPYDADPDEMLDMATEIAQGLSSDTDWNHYLIAPVSVVGVVGFDANGTTIRLKINTTAGNQWAVSRELLLRLKRGMMKKGLDSNWFGRSLFLHQGQIGDGGAPAQKLNRAREDKNEENGGA